MRAAMDVRVLQGEDALRGIGHVTRGLVETLLARSAAGAANGERPRLEIGLIVDGGRAAPDLDMAGAAAVVAVESPGARRWGWSGDGAAVRRAARGMGARILHVHSPLHGPFGWPVLPGGHTVATVYDLIPLQARSEYLDRWPRRARRRYLRRLRRLRGVSALFAISRAVAADFAELAGVGQERIDVAYPAPRPRLVAAARGVERGGAILAFASRNPSKNTGGLLRAMACLDRSVRSRHRLDLVVPGDASEWMAGELARAGLSDSVTLHVSPSDAELGALYGRAGLFVLASTAEGLGLPAIEAMACGAPVAASGLPVLREVLGDAGAFFDPADPASIAQTIGDGLSDPGGLRDRARLGALRGETFRWEAAARVVEGRYARLVSGERR